MISKTMGVLSNVFALLSIWVRNEVIPMWIKIPLSLLCLFFSIIIVRVEYGSFKGKIKDYCYENGKVKHVFIKRNSNFQSDSLVSIYYQKKEKHLCAIGYVIDNNENDLQIVIIEKSKYIVEGYKYLERINQTRRSHIDFYAIPSINYREVEGLFADYYSRRKTDAKIWKSKSTKKNKQTRWIIER